MVLLGIKSDGKYLKIEKDGFQLTNMNKASVYPVKEIEMVKKLCINYKNQLSSLNIIKLTIIEEPYTE